MSEQGSPIRSVVIVAHPSMPEATLEAQKVAEWFTQRGVRAVLAALNDPDMHARLQQGEFDLLVALGGDGTMLRAGHLCAPHQVPILGINLGRFGFLIEVGKKTWPERLPLLLEGKFWQEKRMMLRGIHYRGDQVLGQWDVLNEVVVSRGQMVRPVHLTTRLDGAFLTTYVADGLIASTATGSTAYALAAGGPILPPELRSILIVPVAPHLSVDRAIVLAEGSSASITVYTTHQAVISPDGQAPLPMEDGDRVDVSGSPLTVCFLRFQDPGYFYRNLTSHMNRNPSTGAIP